MKKNFPNHYFRAAFIGYRDFCDKKERISKIDFDEDMHKVKNFIKNQKATGGGDAAEDVIGALEESFKLSYNPQTLLCSFFICDAPCHGK